MEDDVLAYYIAFLHNGFIVLIEDFEFSVEEEADGVFYFGYELFLFVEFDFSYHDEGFN